VVGGRFSAQTDLGFSPGKAEKSCDFWERKTESEREGAEKVCFCNCHFVIILLENGLMISCKTKKMIYGDSDVE